MSGSESPPGDLAILLAHNHTPLRLSEMMWGMLRGGQGMVQGTISIIRILGAVRCIVEVGAGAVELLKPCIIYNPRCQTARRRRGVRVREPLTCRSQVPPARVVPFALVHAASRDLSARILFLCFLRENTRPCDTMVPATCYVYLQPPNRNSGARYIWCLSMLKPNPSSRCSRYFSGNLDAPWRFAAH